MRLFIFTIIDIIVSVSIVKIFNIIESKKKEQEEQENDKYKDKDVFTLDDLHKRIEERKKREQENKGE